MLAKTNELQRSTPESQGIASSAILDFVQTLETQIKEIHSFMLLRHGYVVAEGWWSPYAPEHPHMLFSLSKSFTSTAVGFAVGEGLFSVDDSVISFFPDDLPDEISDNLKAMTVHHLLSMGTGHDVDTMPFMFEDYFNWVKGFLAVPVLHEPGTHFLYNTGASYMLSAIVQKTTGLKLTEYLKPRLFEPLGIEGARWQRLPQGIEMGGFGLSIKTEDIARFGQLYLQKGQWQGKQILSEAWIDKATSSQISNGDDPNNDWNQGYAYQFWRCKHNNYRGDGAFGQYCIVMPEQDAVLAITGGLGDMQKPLNIVWDTLLPAMQSDTLPDDSDSHRALTETLSRLLLPMVEGQATSSHAADVSGRTYHLEANDLKIETVAFDFAAGSIRIKSSRGEETIPFGFQQWQEGESKLFIEEWEDYFVPIVSSGAWIDDNHFRMIVRLYETPFFHSYDFVIDGDDLTLKTRVNVGFMPPETVLIKGQAG